MSEVRPNRFSILTLNWVSRRASGVHVKHRVLTIPKSSPLWCQG